MNAEQQAEILPRPRSPSEQLTTELNASRRLHELSTRLIQGGEVDALYQQMLDTAVAIMRSDCASMQVLDPGAGGLRLLASRGFHPQSAQFWNVVEREAATTCGVASRHGARAIVTDTECCSELAGSAHLAEFRRSGIRAVQSTPLLSRSGQLLGMISTHWREPYEPTDGDLRTFDILVRQCADLLERKQAEDALRELDRRKDVFLATLAHELRNPLAPLRTGLEIMKRAPDQPELVARMRDLMERQVLQLVHLVEGLLDISRFTFGKIELQRAPVELTAIVRQAVESLPALMHERHFVLLAPAAPLYVDGDAARLMQVFGNLLGNAFKFSVPHTRIEVEITSHGSEAIIAVRDQGVGIPPEKLEAIFDLFTQLHTELEDGKSGLGIGLPLVRQLVNLHGGHVSAASAGQGHGAEFLVRLPLLAGPASVPQH